MSNTKAIAEKLQQLTFFEMIHIGRDLSAFVRESDLSALTELDFSFFLLGWAESELEEIDD